ncbi:electron transporter RnfD [Candidatus Tenderia electrophaga]|jgi:electron transport complex protein RnfD|uniref:Ion-translocating oxidoreductase complex subunit D n=1 Tax=Candidatus Tenderia electrophaga TaxID=1748243 RepID=A0A0S2TBG1_9GAMM|nr:electron transporter RnfD [Candidatus Tenderia electrophaga]
MMLRTPSSPHFHGPTTVTGVMLRVVYALIPGIIAYFWLFGWGVIINIVLAAATALLTEAAMLRLRGRPAGMYLSDGSALVTAVLLGLALPPLAPWWVVFIGTAFAIVFAKHLYGGLGFNPFNPAMVGYVMLLISFPREMTAWPAPLSLREVDLGLGQSLAYVFGGNLPVGITFDALTMATPLDDLKTQLGLDKAMEQITARPIYGMLGGTGWEWINLAFLAGGLWLIRKKIISWHVPVGMLGTLGVVAFLFHIVNPDEYASPLFHLFSGGAILGAFFIATDPVSGATTPKGRLYFGIGVGLLTYIIRNWGGYPDAVAFAVLLMNMGAPTLDYYTRPRVFGHRGE